MIKIIAQAIFGLGGLAMGASFFSSVIFTGSALDKVGLTSENFVGMVEFAALRGCIALFTCGAVALYFFHDPRWLWPAVLVTLAIMVSRITAASMLGFSQFHTNALMIEALVLATASYLAWDLVKS